MSQPIHYFALTTYYLSIDMFKVVKKDGGGWFNYCGWAEENKAGGLINELKPLITVDITPCRPSSKIGQLRAEPETISSRDWLDPAVVSSSTSSLELINFF